MKTNRKAISKFTLAAIVVSLLLISTAAYAALPVITGEQTSKMKKFPEFSHMPELSKLLEDSATTYDEFKEMRDRAISQRQNTQLGKDKIAELYDKGYSLSDIEKAEELSFLSGKNTEEILSQKYTDKGSHIEVSDKPWEDIKAELGLDKDGLVTGQAIPDDVKKQLEEMRYDEKQIVEIHVLHLNYNKDYNSIIKDMESGKNYDQLDEQYWNEQMNRIKDEAANNFPTQQELESIIIEQYNITDDIVTMCSKYGISQVSEIGYAITLAKQYELELEYVLKKKYEISAWIDVIKELEVEKK